MTDLTKHFYTTDSKGAYITAAIYRMSECDIKNNNAFNSAISLVTLIEEAITQGQSLNLAFDSNTSTRRYQSILELTDLEKLSAFAKVIYNKNPNSTLFARVTEWKNTHVDIGSVKQILWNLLYPLTRNNLLGAWSRFWFEL